MLLILVACSQVYLGNIMAGNLPPPPPIFPAVTFPLCATQGIPTTHGNASASAEITPPTTLLTGKEDDDILLEQDNLKEQLLQVTPGSPEAHDLMEILGEMAQKLNHSKTKTTASLLGMFAKVLWKDRQGRFQGHVSDII